MGIPGLTLPNQYLDNSQGAIGSAMGANPNDLAAILASLQPSTMGNSNYQQSPQAQPNPALGDASTLSGRIQEWLGAKEPNQGGQVQDILSARFQPDPTSNDVGNAAIATLQSGQYVPAQQYANSRLSSSFDTLDKLAKMQETRAQANYYNAVAQNGGGRGEALALLNKLNNDPTTAGLDLATKLTMVKGGIGVGNTMVNGAVQPIQGNLQTIQDTANAKQTGTEAAQIAGAAPKASQAAIGEKLGEAQTGLATIQANMPQINAIVDRLHTLGQTATYTQAGQLYNSAVRQIGMGVPQGAKDRAEYEATINNFLLPILKQTFGARVTNFDIQNIKTTLADINLSPQEKDAQLKAFINQKALSLTTNQNQVQSLGGSAIPAQSEANQSINSQAPNIQGAKQAPDGNFYVPDPSRPGKYLMVQP